MKCLRAKELLSEYVDGALDAGTRMLFEEHIASCRDCREEVEFLKTCIKEISSMDKVKPPADFLEKVHDRLSRLSEFEKMMQKLFTPVKMKVSIEVAGILTTLLLFVVVTSAVLNRYSVQKAEYPRSADAFVRDIDMKNKAVAELADREVATGALLSEQVVASKMEPVEAAEGARPIEIALLVKPETPVMTYGKVETKFAVEKEAAKAPLNLSGTLSKVEDLVKLAGGKVISTEHEKGTVSQQLIIADIPFKNYPSFMEKLGVLGTVSQPKGTDAPEKTKAENIVRLHIKLVTSQ